MPQSTGTFESTRSGSSFGPSSISSREGRSHERARIDDSQTTMTGVALLLLWGASWGMSYLDLGPWCFVIAFGIAAAEGGSSSYCSSLEIALREDEHPRDLGLRDSPAIAILLVFMIADVKTREAPLLVTPTTGAVR